MSADSPRCQQVRNIAMPAVVPPQVVSDRSILDSAIGFISDVTLVAHQPHTEPRDTIIWARFETAADISDPCFGVDWEIEGNVAPPLLLILGYGLGVQVWAIPANGEAVEVLSWRHGVVSTLRILPTPTCTRSTDEHGRADETIDVYAEKRPLIALVDSSTTSSQPQFCALNFISLKTGKQVKTIKFKNPILDVVANRTSVATVFHERLAVFDARTLEDRLSITTCYPSPGINPNPVALGQRWLAYAEQKLLPSKRSGGGWDGEGIASYTATVLNAAKSFGKGLRELGEQVAAGLTGTSSSGSLSKNSSFDSNAGIDAKQPGIVTIIDIEQSFKDYSPTPNAATNSGSMGTEPIVAHFIAHAEAIVAMEFDNSGMLLLTADRRGHDFNVFRIQPHPVSPSLSAVHHLYVLHRGDTSAKVQNVSFSLDSRWVAVSTLRGTTHVFPITPYGGSMGVRTHTSLHVVNKLSRFHRSAGLSADGRSNSPITHSENTTFMQSLQPYHNTTLPPFPRPTVVLPLAQLRQPFALGSPPVSAGLVMPGKIGGGGGSVSSGGGSSTNISQRQRHTSLSDDNGKPLSVCAIFAKSRSWLLEPANVTREASHRIQRKAIDSLFVMAGHGALIQYDLDTKLASNIAKEKMCDDAPIELDVEAKAQWNLGRRRDGSLELMPPLANDNWLMKNRNSCLLLDSMCQYDDMDEKTESWVSQVEIITHAGPHRRLWMGPQCVFKTYNTPSGSNLNHVDVEAIEIGVAKPTSTAAAMRSHPLSMPVAAARSNLPVLIESGSYSSIEQSPKLMDRFRHEHLDSDFTVSHGDSRLKEDLADAMRESPSVSDLHKNTCRLALEVAASSFDNNASFYDARADFDIGDDDSDLSPKSLASFCSVFATTAQQSTTTTTMTAKAKQPTPLPNWVASSNIVDPFDRNRMAQYSSNKLNRNRIDNSKPSTHQQQQQQPSVEKVVNPLGTVTTVISGMACELRRDILDEVVSQLAAEEDVIHENCDESLFRPVVAIFCDDRERQTAAKKEADEENEEFRKPPEAINNKLVVPVIPKEMDAELSKRAKGQKSDKMKMQKLQQDPQIHNQQEQQSKQESYRDKKVNVIPSETNETEAATENIKYDGRVKGEDEDEARVKDEDEGTVKVATEVDTKQDTTTSSVNSDDSTKDDSVKCEVEKDDSVKCELEKELKTSQNKMKVSESKKHTAAIVEEEKEAEPLEFKRMTPMPVTKNRKQISDSKATTTKAIRSNEVKRHSKAGLKNSTECRESNENIKAREAITTDKLEPTDKLKEAKKEQTDKSDESEKGLLQPKAAKILRKESFEETPCPILKVESDDGARVPLKERTSPIEASASKQKSAANLNTDQDQGSSKDHEQCDIHGKPIIVTDNANKKASAIDDDDDDDNDDDNDNEIEATKVLLANDTNKKFKLPEGTPAIVDNSLNATAVADEKQIDDGKSVIEASTLSSKKQTGEHSKANSTDLKELQKMPGKKNGTKSGSEEVVKKSSSAQQRADSKPILNTRQRSSGSVGGKSDMAYGENVESVDKSKNQKLKTANSNQATPIQSCPPLENPPIVFNVDDVDVALAVNVRELKSEKIAFSNEEITIEPKSEACPIGKSEKPPNSAWKAVSKNNECTKTKNVEANAVDDNYPSLGAIGKTKKATKNKENIVEKGEKNEKSETSEHNILSDISKQTMKIAQKFDKKLNSANDNKSEKKWSPSSFEAFPALKPLEALPPLPTLEPLDIAPFDVLTHKANNAKSSKTIENDAAADRSLINFDSPLQEDPNKYERKEVSQQNVILAFCGSLHYENDDNTCTSDNKLEIQQTISSGTDEQSTAGEYKLLHELEEEMYLGSEQTKPSKLKTNKAATTTTTVNKEKFSSSDNSSASEEIVVIEEKKMSKKQRRKRQQMEAKKQKEREEEEKAVAARDDDDDDEELRPLIGMTDSHTDIATMLVCDDAVETPPSVNSAVMPRSADSCSRQEVDVLKPVFIEARASPLLGHSTTTTTTTTTTDSEGPIPATTTTSDDSNIFILPLSNAATTTHTTTNAPIKIKTKRLEHKINLMAAIDAATSSSTSSAEESNVEAENRNKIGSSDPELPLPIIGISTTMPIQPILTNCSSLVTPSSATKKKTKRRKR